MATLFSDNFEAGNLVAWTGTNGVVSAQAAAAFAGSFGAELVRDEAFAYKDFSAPASQLVTHGAEVKIVTLTGGGQARILQISEGGTSIARLIYDNGTYKLWLNQKDGTIATSAIAATLTAGTWYLLQLVYDWSGAQPKAQLYVDGVLDTTLTDATSGTTRQATRVFILDFEDALCLTGQVYVDNVLVEDTAPSGGGGTTYTEAGQATTIATASGGDAAVYTETGGAASAATASAADSWTMADAGQALAAWSSGALDTIAMVDAGGGVLVAVASGSDGSAPMVELPYQGDATIYDSSGATGSIANGLVQPGDTVYDTTSATGSIAGTTMPPDVTYG